jgi:hypothetical protein
MHNKKLLIGIMKNLENALIDINNLETEDLNEPLDKYTLYYSITCILENIKNRINK